VHDKQMVLPGATKDSLKSFSYRLAASKKAQRRPGHGQSQNAKTQNEGDLTATM
jgi:hypothetical protein